MSNNAIERVRAIALSLPEVNERLSHGAPSFFLRDKRPICYFHDADFAGDGRVSLMCPAPPGAQAFRVALDPKVFFAPTPSASGVFRDWIGVYVDRLHQSECGWHGITDVIEDAYRVVAPKKLIAELDARNIRDQT
ncbi:MAG: MmcQ/YjbR family DNA-binding protein [Acidimicrobiales bacterium]|nr:MmcQ/YjbR family DNA-binding protein [Acidimicrobiales bacterium]